MSDAFNAARMATDLFMTGCRHQAEADRGVPDLGWHDPANTCTDCVREALTRAYYLGTLAPRVAPAETHT